MNSRSVIRLLEQHGWLEVAQVGSHKQFKHPTRPGRVTDAASEAGYPARDVEKYREAGCNQAAVTRSNGVGVPMEYIAYLHKEKSSDFGVSFPDFPGCVTAGGTLDEARALAVEALILHMAGMLEDGEALPEPSTLDDVANDPAMRGAVAFLVSAKPPEKTVRVNITARESQIETIDRLARAKGMTRSAYMVQSAVRTRPTTRNKKILCLDRRV